MRLDKQATRREQRRHSRAVDELRELFGFEPGMGARSPQPTPRHRSRTCRRRLRLLRSAVVRSSFLTMKREGWLPKVAPARVPTREERRAAQRLAEDAAWARHVDSPGRRAARRRAGETVSASQKEEL